MEAKTMTEVGPGRGFSTEELSLYVVGLVDDALAAQIEFEASSDEQLANKLYFMAHFAKGDALLPEPPARVDERDRDAHPLDRKMGIKLKTAVQYGTEIQLKAALQELVFNYGDGAKRHIRTYFPDCLLQKEIDLLNAGLQSLCDHIEEFDDAKQSLRHFFLGLVCLETLAFIRRAVEAGFARSTKEIPDALASSEGESLTQTDQRPTRNESE